jgi:formate dehydrogenase iron-sulfur subunit
MAKYLGFAAMGLAAAAGVLHSALVSPNRVSNEDEEKAEDLVKEKS